ncbi:MAG: outer membrane beta-barrel protein [Planctomycetes bacterium]|nr:outer membrane beta-barrel protein [Planctomycetota bacterium]
MKLSTIAVAWALAMAVALPTASAQEVLHPWEEYDETGFYFGTRTGLNLVFEQTASGPFIKDEIDYKNALSFGAAIGYDFDRTEYGRLRLEGEFFYRNNEVEEIISNAVIQDPGGETITYAAMFNAYLDSDRYYELDWGPIHTDVTPYVGAGAGLVVVDQAIRFADVRFSDTDTVLGLQGMGGVSMRIVDGVDFFTELRLLLTTGPTMDRSGMPVMGPAVRVDGEYDAFTLLAGVRVNLR